MTKFVLCLAGTCRVLTKEEFGLEEVPSGTQMYNSFNGSWYQFLPNGDRDVWRHLDIGGVFPNYRLMALLLT